jgi:hypothetical protein
MLFLMRMEEEDKIVEAEVKRRRRPKNESGYELAVAERACGGRRVNLSRRHEVSTRPDTESDGTFLIFLGL